MRSWRLLLLPDKDHKTNRLSWCELDQGPFIPLERPEEQVELSGFNIHREPTDQQRPDLVLLQGAAGAHPAPVLCSPSGFRLLMVLGLARGRGCWGLALSGPERKWGGGTVSGALRWGRAGWRWESHQVWQVQHGEVPRTGAVCYWFYRSMEQKIQKWIHI